MSHHTPRRGPGICAIRGDCGKKGIFGQALPCADDGDAEAVSTRFPSSCSPLTRSQTTEDVRRLLGEVCGSGWPIPDTICCTSDQINTLKSSLQQAEPLIASCPACRNNFRAYHCSFTCSPDQSLFLDVTRTQKTEESDKAVAEVDYYVDEALQQGFYESCRDVQFGATNGFAMDLIGGGAKNASGFLKYMGDYRPGLGSPFQISIPDTRHDNVPQTIEPLSYAPLDCAANDLAARCTCIDCPRVCPTLPPVPAPRTGNAPTCTVGAVSCLTFTALILYSVAILAGLIAYSWKLSVRHRQRRYERLALVDPPLGSPSGQAYDGTNLFSHHNISSPSPASPSDARPDSDAQPPRHEADASSHPSHSSRFRLGRGASLLDPIDQLQPRQNGLNLALRGFFYRLGYRCANYRGKSPGTSMKTAPLIPLVSSDVCDRRARDRAPQYWLEILRGRDGSRQAVGIADE